MTAALVLLLAAVLIVVGAGSAGAPGLGADQRLANSEQQGWAAR